jgi:hypothetical protein
VDGCEEEVAAGRENQEDVVCCGPHHAAPPPVPHSRLGLACSRTLHAVFLGSLCFTDCTAAQLSRRSLCFTDCAAAQLSRRCSGGSLPQPTPARQIPSSPTSLAVLRHHSALSHHPRSATARAPRCRQQGGRLSRATLGTNASSTGANVRGHTRRAGGPVRAPPLPEAGLRTPRPVPPGTQTLCAACGGVGAPGTR